MKIVRRIGIICFLLVFLFGITGISFYHHTCSSSNDDNVTVYPGIFEKPTLSCCENETTAQAGFTDSGSPVSIEATPCCKSISTYLKLQVITVRSYRLVLNLDNTLFTVFPLRDRVFPAIEQFFTKHFFLQFHPPPLAGRTLLQFLHQIKIPSHPATS